MQALPQEPDKRQACDEKPSAVDRNTVWGLYCMYLLVGTVNGFFVTFINVPICQYVFGPMNEPGRSSVQQCNIAQSLFQMPWNFKIFYAFILDRVMFCGSRRRGWIIFGWTVALAMLLVLSFSAHALVDSGSFDLYVIALMVVCFFYMFADVAGDGMTIELTRHEPEGSKGHILATGQMLRFLSMTAVTLLGTFCMNGESYYNPAKATKGDTVFSFEVPFTAMHFLIVGCCVPCFIGMVLLLKDPPAHKADDAQDARGFFSTAWNVLKTKVMLFLILQALGALAFTSMLNPAANILSSIASPSTLQNGLGTSFGNIIFVIGVWIYRTYLLNYNWRITFLWTSVLTAMNAVFQFIVIYNAWGVGQDGWFYGFGNNVTLFVQGIAQVLGSQAVAEFAPPGYEASVYEFMSTMHNTAGTLAANFQNLFVPVFELNSISTASYVPSVDNPRLAGATWLTLAVNVGSAFIVMWVQPTGTEQTRQWAKDARWHRASVGIANLVVFLVCFLFSNTVSFLSLFPQTNCLQIAGGDGC
eukprot:TRINITY_DN623_c0_g1_i1.p1 TRINITY_DN623_c0_g1~~TRINITY_DN623_c0_g1_i1.p1  ORF type:complete len:571 (-),score=98.73 TRINITY_DN623_c0_g1_i1:179-1765(-)